MKNKKMQFVICATVLSLAIVVFAGVKLMSKSNRDSEKKVDLPVTYITVDWAIGYADIDDVTDNSDIIAVVKITGVNKEKNDVSQMTYYNATIKQSILNSKNETNIVIPFTGVNNNTEHDVVLEDPLPDIGDEYLIFAKQNEKGTYTILSGCQGRYEYKNGIVNSLNYTHSTVGHVIDVHNKDINELKNEIQVHLNNKKIKTN